MGIMKRAFDAITKSPEPEIRTVTFDCDWLESMESLRQEFAGKNKEMSISIRIPDELCEEICVALEQHVPSLRIPYSESKTPINNVGESFRQNELRLFCDNKSGEEMDWVYGFLMPEILNPYDKTAVGIYALKRTEKTAANTELFDVVQAGYLEKETARKVHKKILNLLGKDQYVPLLIRMTGGNHEKPNYGAFPYVMCEKIKFE